MTYRNQWPSMGANYVTSMVTYEQSFINKNNGVGILLINDRSSNGVYSLNGVNLYFSNQQNLNSRLNLKVGLETGYKQNFIDNDKLYFEDSFNGESFSNISSEPFLNGLKSYYLDVGMGILLFNENSYIGLSVNHLNEPNQSLLFGKSRLPMKFGLHGLLITEVNKSSYPKDKVFYIPSFSFTRQGEFTELTVNNNFKNRNLLVGVGFRLVDGYSYRDAFIVNFGVDTDTITFLYGYDFTISPIGPSNGGAHEITTIIKVNRPQPKKRVVIPPCTF